MIERIEAELLEAMKSGDTSKRETLRMLKSSLKNAEIEKGTELGDEEVISVIQKEVKRRKEAFQSYQDAGRPEQAKLEEEEATILGAYLPEQMSESDLRALISEYLAKNPVAPNEIGKAMGALSAELKGKADMGLVSRLVRELVTGTGTA
ncbi:MAG: GatB/YqeY domain-containing protein [Candidatus Berkelbacteria bacterium]|nr:MAG: GatB/YqeY domain-containing protein [Candidatus Berkelbacteria bacterium]QQG51410.1 MAG: GatB/YqeY domain-containing protein [Candidatus Berkelbacteria bacterium]